MPLFDKVKAQATQLAQKAQEAGKAGQAKLEDVQARRRYDELLRDLGAAVYADHFGDATPETREEIERLLRELHDAEPEHGPVPATAGSGEEPEAAEQPESVPPGGFTLDA